MVNENNTMTVKEGGWDGNDDSDLLQLTPGLNPPLFVSAGKKFISALLPSP
jgi:hypothetical protein